MRMGITPKAVDPKVGHFSRDRDDDNSSYIDMYHICYLHRRHCLALKMVLEMEEREVHSMRS